MNTKIFVFGGCNGSYNCLDDLHMIDFGSFLAKNDGASLEWIKIQPEGTLPTSRWGHSCVSYKDSLYLFGGRSSGDFNDVHRFSVEDNKWIQIEIEGKVPSERRRSTAEVCGNQMIIFGGYNSNYFNCMHYLTLNEERFCEPVTKKKEYVMKLWRTKKLADVTFVVENKRIVAHRILLHLVDPGFERIFSMSQEDGTVVIKDTKYRYFENIVSYCYSKFLEPICNLGHILGMKSAAKRLGLAIIEREIDYLLQTRRKIQTAKHTRSIINVHKINEPSFLAQFGIRLRDSKKEIAYQDHSQTSPRDSSISRLWERCIHLRGRYHDIKIQINGHNYNCHKVILACAGSFFKNLVARDFRESQKDTIKLETINGKMFELVLSFIYYKDEFLQIKANSLPEKDWICLLKTAHYLSLWELILFCETRLLDLLKPENIFYLLDLSTMYHFEKLERGCLSYIASNSYSPDVRTEFNQFVNSHQQMEPECLKVLISYCEEIKFEIYQKGVILKNSGMDFQDLNDVLFASKFSETGECQLSSKACLGYYGRDEADLNTSNYHHVKNSLISN